MQLRQAEIGKLRFRLAPVQTRAILRDSGQQARWILASKSNNSMRVCGICVVQFAMPDYYPALARTVLRLPNNNAAARQELYELARSKIGEILLKRDLKVSEREIARERAALEAAINRVEEDFKFVQARTAKGPTRNRPTTAVAEDGDDDNVDVRVGRLGEDETKVLSALSRSQKRSAPVERVVDSAPASDRRPADARGRTTIDPHGFHGAVDRGAMMERWRDRIEIYAAGLGDSITGPMLISIAFAGGMMVLTGLMYATIMLTIWFIR